MHFTDQWTDHASDLEYLKTVKGIGLEFNQVNQFSAFM